MKNHTLPTLSRRQIQISGIVQGVGFRPFVYNLALRLGIHGFVLNDASGVIIEAQGDKKTLDDFLRCLKKERPTLSRIDKITTTNISLANKQGFEVLHSIASKDATTLIPTDIAMCAACEAELFDPSNRRFGYPFINCTNCGPRYSITKKLPYDRKNTSMSKFKMCEECAKEYVNPSDRRFHAQPIGCPNCGPKLELTDDEGRLIADTMQAIDETAKIIENGGIVAIKGIGGFHLVCDATNEDALQKLR